MPDKSCIFYWYELKNALYKQIILLSPDKTTAIEWFKHICNNFEKQIKTEEKVLFIPIVKFEYPFPKNNRDVYHLLFDKENKAAEFAGQFFNDLTNMTILISLPGKTGSILIGWRHKPWSYAQDLWNGFPRKDKMPLDIRFARSGNLEINKISVIRCDKERLFQRVGLPLEKSLSDSKIAIIGCGSVGSQIAMSLSKCSISNFFLCDPDTIKIENIARHICNHDDAINDSNKASAVELKIKKHFPFAKIVSSKENILELLRNNVEILNDVNLIIVTIANKAVERRLNALQKTGSILPPILYVWMEPFGVAGQIVYIDRDLSGCFNCCFDASGNFKSAVTKDNQDFIRRESGCQNSFMPYSNIGIESFVTEINRFIISIFRKKPINNLVKTWVGDTIEYEKTGYKLADRWLLTAPFSSKEEIINPDTECRICSKKELV